METGDSLRVAITADTRGFEQSLDNVTDLARQFGATMTNSLKSAVTGGKSFRETLSSLGQSLARLALSSATKPLENLLGGGFSSLLSNVLPFAKGGVVGASLPIPFASGGVISNPTFFPLNGRQTGLAGEAGPEAILPLKRGSDGRLGVSAGGGGSATTINFNVTAEDANSFRRSESQIAAMVQRAVSRGQRNL